jgi:3-oxoacyl-[acyl-carrier-protein] synthase-3
MGICYLAGLGAALPDQTLDNHAIAKLVDTTDAWIRERSGISSRHVLREGEQITDLATAAARQALALAGQAADSLTHVIGCTCTSEYFCPTTAATVAARIGAPPVMAFDLNAACSGFLYGLNVARCIALAHPEARILVVGSEALTRKINWTDRSSCFLFGDGAGATLVGAKRPDRTPDMAPNMAPNMAKDMGEDTPVAVIEDVLCYSNGADGMLLTVGGGTHRGYVSGETAVDDDFFIHMSGREIFKFAVRNMVGICRTMLERNRLALADVDLIIPHQANLRIIEAVAERLPVDSGRVFVNIQHIGNTSAASLPLAMTEAWRTGRLRPGMKALLVTFGGGLTWSAALLRFLARDADRVALQPE